ncbi:MAG: hypothetical protein EPO13_02500 [Actinomycetota bacterium]|nr:MAG: hypothetical protein EPO13_02500 [Actinomycetota bacterium]
MTRRRFFRDNGLSIAFGVLFVLALAAQSWAGMADENHQLALDQQDPVSWLEYVTSSNFAVDIAENWQSEYLQFFLFITLTIWLVQRGSPESKKPEDAGSADEPDDATRRSSRPVVATGWGRQLYSRSLSLTMLAIFIAAWLVQSFAGLVVYNDEQERNELEPISWPAYLASGDFWNRTLQNWQSELLAVGSMVIFAVYLRQRGSPESKAVDAPHDSQ